MNQACLLLLKMANKFYYSSTAIHNMIIVSDYCQIEYDQYI